ncbi:hypothetical protein EOA22_32585, partial [Mesorhizobium sp. M7A.F.Ca.US.014.04.1.1]
MNQTMLHAETQRYETHGRLTHLSFDRSRQRERVLKERQMKKLILASVSGLALLGVAACSDSGTDNTTT